MTDHRHAARYRAVSDAMRVGDMSEMADYLSDDVEWWEIGASEPIRGKAALMARMQDLGGIDISVDLHDVLSNDEHMVALVTATATKDNNDSLTYRTSEIYHVDDDGRVTHRWAFSDDTERINAFFG